MNNTEQFDEWIRGEMNNLDDSPEHFQQADIWQKLQTELHPVAKKKSFFVTVRASHYRIAAAAVLLFLVGGIWWKMPFFTPETADMQVVENKVVLPKKQLLIASKKEAIEEKVTLKQQVSLKQLPKEKSTKINLAQVTSAVELGHQIGTNHDVASLPTAAESTPVTNSKVAKPTVEVAAVQLPEVVAPPATKLTNLTTIKNKTKPKFKIVHANELTDYQRVELAEAKEKEAKSKGFVVINWQINANNQSENSIMSYLKKKNVTTPTVIVE
jgi:hypothetical protein